MISAWFYSTEMIVGSPGWPVRQTMESICLALLSDTSSMVVYSSFRKLRVSEEPGSSVFSMWKNDDVSTHSKTTCDLAAFSSDTSCGSARVEKSFEWSIMICYCHNSS